MLKVTVIAVGGLKENYWHEACGEYQKRLRNYCNAAVIEVSEYRLPENPSAGEIAAGLEAEGREIISRIPKDSYVTALCVEGKTLSSEEFARNLADSSMFCGSHVFIIGGSHGLSDSVKALANMRLSFGKMTLPHRLARVLLLEQLYRAFSINAGGKYHK